MPSKKIRIEFETDAPDSLEDWYCFMEENAEYEGIGVEQIQVTEIKNGESNEAEPEQ